MKSFNEYFGPNLFETLALLPFYFGAKTENWCWCLAGYTYICILDWLCNGPICLYFKAELFHIHQSNWLSAQSKQQGTWIHFEQQPRSLGKGQIVSLAQDMLQKSSFLTPNFSCNSNICFVYAVYYWNLYIIALRCHCHLPTRLTPSL